MRFLSVMLGLLCLPVLVLGMLLAPAIAPAVLALAWFVPGFAAFTRTSGKRSWNLASYHSPHSLTWRWLIGVSFGSIFARPTVYL